MLGPARHEVGFLPRRAGISTTTAAISTDRRDHRERSTNNDLRADIAAMHTSRDFYEDQWADGHRNGADGFANPESKEVKDYRAALWFTQKKIYANPELLRNDTRVYVNVPRLKGSTG